MTVKTKICGITCQNDAHAALACGADYIGTIVNIAGSHRSVSIQQAIEICSVAHSSVVLMEGPINTVIEALHTIQPSAIQLIGPFTIEDIQLLKKQTNVQVWKSVHVPRSGQGDFGQLEQQLLTLKQINIDTIVLDTLVPGKKGGTGQTCDWAAAAQIVKAVELPVFLAGGLGPDNIAQAIAAVDPFGVDVSSGVESSPGKKDRGKMTHFVQQATKAKNKENTKS